jgi:hypothetical protein
MFEIYRYQIKKKICFGDYTIEKKVVSL